MNGSRRRWPFLASSLLAVAVALVARGADAHLMAAGHGTLNVVGNAVFAVLSVPASALSEADDDHDGLLSTVELGRHEAELRASVDRRLSILDGVTMARTVRVDLILSPEHGTATDRAGHVVILKHVELDAAPSDLRVVCDLFGTRESDRAFSITATRHPGSGAETDVGTLSPNATKYSFFPADRRSNAKPGCEGGVPPLALFVVGALAALFAGWVLIGYASVRWLRHTKLRLANARSYASLARRG